MASAVSGLTNADAPSAASVPSGSSRHCDARTIRYCAYIPRRRRRRSGRPGIEPAPRTRPRSPCRPLHCRPAATGPAGPPPPAGPGPGTSAVMTGCSGVPDALAVLRSAPASSRPRSDGLMGAASTRISTSSGPGSGTSTVASDNSSRPSAVTNDRSCCPVAHTALPSASCRRAATVHRAAGRSKGNGQYHASPGL